MATPRQNPVKGAVAKVGNYAAPVDTTGMDKEDIVGLGVKRQTQLGRVNQSRTKRGLKPLIDPASKEARK
jgi:hypothetical protein